MEQDKKTNTAAQADSQPERLDYIDCTDCLEGMQRLPKGCASLIIADPPYYRVKGDFDFGFESREAFLRECDRWAAGMERILAANGSLIWYCSDQMQGRLQVMLENRFNFLNSCTIVKVNSIQNTMANVEAQRKWFSNEERFLFMEAKGDAELEDGKGLKARNKYRFMEGKLHTECVKPIVDYLNQEREQAGFSVADIQRAFNASVPSHWFTRGSQFFLPTEQWYERLRRLFNSGNGGGEYLRKDYEEQRRPFSLKHRQNDVFAITSRGSTDRKLFNHPTVKNLKLTKELIETTTRPGQLVVAPFAGSGTECVAAAMLGRHFIGFEMNEAYCRTASERAEKARKAASPGLFGWGK